MKTWQIIIFIGLLLIAFGRALRSVFLIVGAFKKLTGKKKLPSREFLEGLENGR